MTEKSANAVQPLLPVELGSGKIKFAQGIKAGRWVFATGLMGQDFVNGIAPEVLAERMPHAGRPKREREAGRIFDNLDAVLRAASTDRANLVRTDQYYTTVAAVPAYQQVRRECLAGRIPPSTSIAQQGLLLPGADMNIQAMAAIPGKGFEVDHLKHEQLKGRPTSGYSPALTVGDYIFIPGITTLAVGDEPRRTGRVVRGDRFDAVAHEELLGLRERLPVRVRALDALEARALRREERVVHADDRLPHDLHEVARAEEVVGLVDRSGLRVLDGDDREVGLTARDARERDPHGLARHRFGIGEQPADGLFAVRPRFPLVGDAHGAESLAASPRRGPVRPPSRAPGAWPGTNRATRGGTRRGSRR